MTSLKITSLDDIVDFFEGNKRNSSSNQVSSLFSLPNEVSVLLRHFTHPPFSSSFIFSVSFLSTPILLQSYSYFLSSYPISSLELALSLTRGDCTNACQRCWQRMAKTL